MKRMLFVCLCALMVLGLSAVAVQAHDDPVGTSERADCTTASAASDGLGGDREAVRGERDGAGAEDEHGSEQDDVIDGRADDDDIAGNDGDDELCGEDGDDHLVGGAGADHLAGGRGDDSELGQAGDDDVDGDQGDDHLAGGKGSDDISGGTGNDVIAARDHRRDSIHCGAGNDRVRADRGDRVSGDCEHVSRS